MAETILPKKPATTESVENDESQEFHKLITSDRLKRILAACLEREANPFKLVAWKLACGE